MQRTEEEDILAKTIYGEARGEFARFGIIALEAVASVVMNRVKDPRKRFGDSVIGVCRRPKQFSCWNSNDINKRKMQVAPEQDKEMFERCLDVACRLISGATQDCTGGALWYHAKSISPPVWTRSLEPCMTVGHHIFYRAKQSKGEPMEDFEETDASSMEVVASKDMPLTPATHKEKLMPWQKKVIGLVCAGLTTVIAYQLDHPRAREFFCDVLTACMDCIRQFFNFQ